MGKLTNCKTCQKEIAKSARSCPGCGAKQGGGNGKWVLIGIIVLIAIGAAGAADKEKKRKEEVSSGVNAIDVSAQQLFDDYEANEVSADTKYRDKVLRVTGRVDRIAKDFTDAPYVVLSTKNEILGVRAEFADKSTGGSLQKGQQLTLRCRGKGKIMEPALGDCVLE